MIEYLKTPPTRLELVDLVRQMDVPLRAILRRQSTPFGALGLDVPALSGDQLLEATEAHLNLVYHPMVAAPKGV